MSTTCNCEAPELMGRLSPKRSTRYMVFSKVGPNQSIEWGQSIEIKSPQTPKQPHIRFSEARLASNGYFTSTQLIGHWQACCTRTMIVDVDTVKKPGNARRLREIIASV
jgi:hypothetical protein